MTTYYRDSTVLVSSSAISVDGASYPIRDLGEGWLAKGPWQPQLAVWAFLFGSPVLLGVLIVVAERTRERGLRYLLLCAEYGGEAVVLYTTTEPRRFGQVHRAVQRALEHHDG